MRVEDVRMATTEFFLGAILDRFELAARESDCRTETTSLSFEIRFGDLRSINFPSPFLQPQNATDHGAVRHAEPRATKLLCSRRRFDVVALGFIKIARKKTDNGV